MQLPNSTLIMNKVVIVTGECHFNNGRQENNKRDDRTCTRANNQPRRSTGVLQGCRFERSCNPVT